MTLRSARILLLIVAAALCVVAAFRPSWRQEVVTYEVMLVVDVTGSMNARDYVLNGLPASRLDVIRERLPAFLAALPCGSKVGLSIFTERRAFALFDPVEVCASHHVLKESFAALDWRMAWEGDSRIASGLHHAIEMAKGRDYDLVFLTDGQEAPPIPWTGGPTFEGEVGRVAGVVVGVGGSTPVPIPKFDDRGREVGFYAMEEIPQESRVGAPPPGAENRPGWHPRNNPYGEMPAGTEHLAQLREPYLVDLAASVGLSYHRLDTGAALAAAVARAARPHPVVSNRDASAYFGAVALMLAVAASIARTAVGAVGVLRKGKPLNSSSIRTVLLASAFVALGMPAAAHGPTPQKVAETIDIGAPCELVWSKLRDFGSIGGWHPSVTAVEANGASERGATRKLTLQNGESVVEKLDEVNGDLQSIAYRLSTENLKALPVSFYTAKMIVSRPTPGPECRVEWEGRFYRGDTTNEPPPELNDEAAVAAMTAFFKVGLGGLKQAME